MFRLLLILLLISYSTVAQQRTDLYERAEALQSELKYNEALDIFRVLLKSDSNDVDLLNRVSYLMAYPVYPTKNGQERQKIYAEAVYLSEKALKLSPGNAYSYYHNALALGRLSEYEGMKSKVANAKRIRLSCERAISIDPTLPGPYHILARWHREVANFNVFEKAMIATFFDNSLEGGNYDDALKYFKAALKLDPLNPIHYYEIAVTYFERGEKLDYHNARTWLHKTMKVHVRNDFDRQVQVKAQKLMKKLQ